MDIIGFGDNIDGSLIRIESNSKGNLPKLDDGEKFFKTGRFSPYKHEGKFSIESLNEVICYHVGKELGLNTLPYKLVTKEVNFRGNKVRVLGCESENYLPENYEEYTLNTFYINSIIDSPTYTGAQKMWELIEHVHRNIIFDYIIYNTDRHANNIYWAISEDDIVDGYIFDNGYSLLFDDLNNLMLGNFEMSCRTSNINAFYNNFGVMREIIKYYRGNLDNIINLKVNKDTLLNNILKVYKEYSNLQLNPKYNIIVDKEYFTRVFEFICCRIEKLYNLINEYGEEESW